MTARALAIQLTLLAFPLTAQQPDEIVVASKKFTESVILGDILMALGTEAGFRVTHRRELGGTQLVWRALLRGDVDAYVDYTGTIREEIFAGSGILDDSALAQALDVQGVRIGAPLGFNNTYALAMRGDVAARLAVASISDLRAHPDLRFGFTNEFMARGDGWPSLNARYQFPQSEVQGLDHDLAYRGLESDAIQVIDVYSTDAEIEYYNLRVLDDDLAHFPVYDAVLLYRADLEQRAQALVARWSVLDDAISEAQMVQLNARAKLGGMPEIEVASQFVNQAFGLSTQATSEGWFDRFQRHTLEHLFLVSVSLGAAIVLAVPLGVVAAMWPPLGRVVLAVVGVIQTIPSLALLVFMIPLLGIGAKPAIVALFLYSLLPIVRNTHAGLRGIPDDIRESAEALGLPRYARLRLVELPMATPSILAGIKTSAVINVGTATLGALIGAGGYGQPILTGIRLDNVGLILEGALPAAALALTVQGVFDLGERLVVPMGLRLARG